MIYMRGLFKILCFSLMSSFLTAPLNAYAKEGRQLAGFYLSFNGDPGPSAVGVNFAVNALKVFRLNAGVGGYNSSLGGTGPAVYNFTLAPIFWFFSKIFTMGLWNPGLKYFRLPYPPVRSSFSYGGGVRILPFVGSHFSPAVGAHYSWIEARRNAYGITGKKTIVYYSGGLDWTSDRGLNLAGGLNYYPTLGASRKVGAYVNLGFFF